MTSVFSDGALHPGRDANDSAWIVLRRPEDWAGATLTDVIVDPGVPALVLRPAPAQGLGAVEIEDLDGTRYRVDADADAVWRRHGCDAAWALFVGTTGTETGKLRRPLGLALDSRRGMLAIADAGNHRVQVVRAATGEPVVVIGCVDIFGRGVASSDPHALDEPVALAFHRGMLGVADRRRGAVNIYDDRFELVATLVPVPPSAPTGFVPQPIAVAIDACIVWVIDAAWSVPIAYDFEGHVTADAGAPPPEIASMEAHSRSASRGDVVVGPIDGQTEDLAWHRVIVDAHVPPGTSVEVQTFASDDPVTPSVIPWAPVRPQRIPIEEVESRDGESARLVVSDQGRWLRKRAEPYLRTNRPLGRLAGTGPNGVAGFTVPWIMARRLRAHDDIELRRLDGTAMPRAIASIAGRTLHSVVSGDIQLYGPGCTLVLVEREGVEPLGGPREIARFSTSDLLDLGAAVDDGTLYDVPASHAVAALVRDGDVLRVEDGTVASATIVVDRVDHSDATVVLALAVVGNFELADLRLVMARDRLVVDQLGWTDDVPAGEPVFVHDDNAGTMVATTLRWAELDTDTVWLEPLSGIPYATWTRFTLADAEPTDRGQYLWVRLSLHGAVALPGDPIAIAGPMIRSLRVVLPRLSLLRYLPQVYSRRDDDDPTGALFLERLLALPESRLTAIEARYEEVARQLNPEASTPEWLRFLAAWYGLVFDPSWPLARRRELVINAHELFAKRGTLEGIRRYLEIYLGTSPSIVEGFQWRAAPPTVLGGERVLGQSALGGTLVHERSGLPHHFSIWVFGDNETGCGETTANAARAIIESSKPAHTTYDLHVIDGSPRVGISTSLGIDMVLVGGAVHPPLGLVSQPPAVVGQMSLPDAGRGANTLAPIPIDHDFTIT